MLTSAQPSSFENMLQISWKGLEQLAFMLPIHSFMFYKFVHLKWWLGPYLSYGSFCPLCSENAPDPLGHHAVTCKRGGDVVNKLHDVLAESCQQAHLEMGSNIMLVPNWVLGKPALLTCLSHPRLILQLFWK